MGPDVYNTVGSLGYQIKNTVSVMFKLNRFEKMLINLI